MSRGSACPRLACLALAAALLVAAPVSSASPFLEMRPTGVFAKLEAALTPVAAWFRGWLDKDGEPAEDETPPPAPNACTGDCTDDGWGADPDGRT